MSEQMNIFENSASASADAPLAEQARPNSLEQILGQDKLLAPGGLLYSMISSGSLSSFIMWGPPGSGKTTIARLVQQRIQLEFVSFSAVFSKIADVKQVMQQADFNLKTRGKPTVLFVDEIHRFNKSQQDAFLPYIESGAVILIGATTENPSFEVIPALMSRCHLFVLQALDDQVLIAIMQNALERTGQTLNISSQGMDFLAFQAGGDARKALNNLQLLVQHHKTGQQLDIEDIKNILTHKTMFYDKGGEEHYNVISALHKSLRGSDPQAGLYWLARMLEAGDDPMYIVRRLVRFASEDVGLADPNALVQAVACQQAVHFLGMPEANTALAQLVVYLATAPKSNSAYKGYKMAAVDAKQTAHLGVPMVIRNAPTKIMKELDYGKGYVYSHDAENSYHYQRCFPDKMEEKTYYTPSRFGFEKDIQKRLDWWASLKKKQ